MREKWFEQKESGNIHSLYMPVVEVGCVNSSHRTRNTMKRVSDNEYSQRVCFTYTDVWRMKSFPDV